MQKKTFTEQQNCFKVTFTERIVLRMLGQSKNYWGRVERRGTQKLTKIKPEKRMN